MDNSSTKKVYEVEDIQKILGISRTSVYEFIKEAYKTQKPFKVLRIGNLYRIPKPSFDKWINGDE